MFPNSTGATVAALALTCTPVPGVFMTTPRGELTLKKFSGRLLGAANASGTPSQLISRRAPPNEPFAPATVPPPRADRKLSTVGVIADAFDPAAENVTTAAATFTGIANRSAAESI